MSASTQTEAQLCSRALLFIGQRDTIDSLEEDSEQAEACKQFYAGARDALLQMFWWKFATRRSALALSTEERTGWQYVYVLPNDCITPRYLYPGVRNPTRENRIPFDLEGAGPVSGQLNRQVLLTDQAEAELIYTSQVTNVALFDPLFVKALQWQLAVELTLALPVKPEAAARAQAQAEIWFRRAAAAHARGSQADETPDSIYVTGR